MLIVGGLAVLIVGAALAAGELEAMEEFSGTTGGESALHPAARATKTSPAAGRSISSTIRPLEESYRLLGLPNVLPDTKMKLTGQATCGMVGGCVRCSFSS